MNNFKDLKFQNMKTTQLKSKSQILLALIFILVYPLLTIPVHAQEVYQVDPSSKIAIDGTSTLHDWTSDVTQFSGDAVIKSDQNNLESLGKLSLTIPVASIKGDHDGMDSKTYDALKKDQYPEIKFSLDKVVKIDPNTVSASGKLSIAGVTKNIDLTPTYKELPGNMIAFTGEKNIKMTDFDVTPPTALLGAIKSGDDITIKFDVAFIRSNNLSYK